MFSIGLLVHAQHLTGSFAAAGVVAGVYALALGLGGPALGRLIDRRGQAPVLVASASVCASLMGIVAALPPSAPLALLVILAIAAGLATPPLGACVRTLFSCLVEDRDALRAAYAVDTTVVELTWIAGPTLVLGLGAAWSTGAALAAAGIMLLVGSAAFVSRPAARKWQPALAAPAKNGGVWRSRDFLTLVIALVAVGTLFGAVEVGVATAATALGATAEAGPLLSVWGLGSMAGGLAAARLGGGARSAGGLALLLGALALGHLALVPAAGSVLAMAAVLLMAGATIAPTYATAYAMAEDVVAPGTLTEAFAWLATAVTMGASIGSALGGILADSAGAAGAFALAGGTGATAVVIIVLRTPVAFHALREEQPTC
jgi:MFS family permease